ncbi:MAG: HAMP domain-containing histidine kinase [Clostridium sp.]|nr:HAMP domain-containing histidine kinase [Clostridium sp.]MCM1444467.1 HAMP domain-containing histidine kinase [Candidatus Amulumruptor caecigallinarius]
MDILKIILMNSIFILFPLLCYLIYEIYTENTSIKKRELFIDFALVTSCYLIFRYGDSYSLILPKLMFNVPLIFACILNRKFTILLLFILGIVYYSSFTVGIYIVLIEYLTYFILYLFQLKYKECKKNYIQLFIILNTMVSFSWMLIAGFNLFQIIIICIIYYFVIYLMATLIEKFDQIITIYKSLKDFQNVKDLRESIFKITHEIKNPIAVCKGYLDMFDVENIEHSKKYVPIMKEEINRVLILLQDFLSLNKINIEKDILDINLLMEEVVDNFKPLLKQKGIKLKFDTIDDEIFIEGDYNRLLQVFINILKNSIESIDENGKIIINLEQTDSLIKINIQDNGVGISKENLKKLKEPFFTTKPDGTGLGVALSNEIIEAHNGTLQYSSVLGKGTSTTVVLNKNTTI